MVTSERFEAFTRAGAAYFPAYLETPPEAKLLLVEFENPQVGTRPSTKGPLDWIDVVVPLHTSFAAEWPIQVHVPTALKGLRHALGLSQAKFAAALGETRLNIERWESGKSRPFRGHTLSLVSLVRPLVDGPLAAGQLLNLAAAVVCPGLTRPAATYTGRDITEPLADRHHDHRDLAPALLEVLVHSEVLVSLDPDEHLTELDARYVPLVGVRRVDREHETWEAEVYAVARRLSAEDRMLWLSVGRRLRPTDANDANAASAPR